LEFGYDAAQAAFKADFLRELVNLAKDNPHPILIGGDFNFLRFSHEKSKGQFDGQRTFLFNTVIDSLDLREVSLSGRQFTWAKNFPEPTYEKLDRVLMDTDWEYKYPMVSVRALECIEKLFDHAPILLTTGTPLYVNVRSSLKLVCYIERGSMRWLGRFGRDRSRVVLPF
jgi:endonuclease/exonuclease/phosphatase family metal-dependent hydrolase